MNFLTFCQPTHLLRSSACKFDIGGYSADGLAWRWRLPDDLIGRAHINLLEFLASVVSIWLLNIRDELPPYSCILVMDDNTTVMGWMHKSNFIEVDESDVDMTGKLLTARHLASIVVESRTCIYSQWFPGWKTMQQMHCLASLNFLTLTSQYSSNHITLRSFQTICKLLNFHKRLSPGSLPCL